MSVSVSVTVPVCVRVHVRVAVSISACLLFLSFKKMQVDLTKSDAKMYKAELGFFIKKNCSSRSGTSAKTIFRTGR